MPLRLPCGAWGYRLIIRHAPPPTPCPYTTLFRSVIFWLDARCLKLKHGFAAQNPQIKSGFARLAWRFVLADCQGRSEEHTSELQSRGHLVCRLLLEKKKIR